MLFRSRVFNAMGVLVSEQVATLNMQIDVLSLTPGVYFLELNSVCYKFIINH